YTEIFKLSLENNPEAVFPRAVDIAMSTGKVATMPLNTVLTSKDGRQIPILDSAAPLKDIDGKIFGCVVVMRDNTKERELERSKDEFLSVASHQLRTPLGSIRWNLELLLAGDYGEITGDARTAANQIHDGTLRMIALVNDLLNVSRIDQGRVMDEPVETNLGNIVKQKTGDLKMLADREKVEMSVNVAENLPNVVIDPKRFGEVITNLVSNSIKYHKENGWVKIELNMTDDKFKLTIADNGIGIPKKDEGRLFEKFYRADNAVKSQTEGSGLGLYIAKKFIEGWGGSITAESEEGQGTTFTIYLPKDIKRIKQEEKV
ncbi:MAG TPA: ATP-binding protein, partial [Patescibacteria group bacterium]